MNDWLAMTRSPRCSFRDKGVLIDALDLYWQGQCAGLPSDVQELAKVIGCKKAEAQSMLANTTGYEIIEGKLHWESVEKSFLRAKRLQEKGQAGGRASAKARSDRNVSEQPQSGATYVQPIKNYESGTIKCIHSRGDGT